MSRGGWNPYDVGTHGGEVVERKGTCQCCELDFIYKTRAGDPTAPAECPACEPHMPLKGETAEHEAWRRREDAPRIHERVTRAAAVLAKYESERGDLKRQTRRALESRDTWEELATALAGEHVEKLDRSCSCGARDHARCPTVRAGLDTSGYLLRRVWTNAARRQE